MRREKSASRLTVSCSTVISSVRICSPLLSKKKGVGLADFLGDEVHAVRRLHDGIDDLGRRNHDVAQFARELDEERLVFADADRADLRKPSASEICSND